MPPDQRSPNRSAAAKRGDAAPALDTWLSFDDLRRAGIVTSRKTLREWQRDPRIGFPSGRLLAPSTRRWSKQHDIDPWLAAVRSSATTLTTSSTLLRKQRRSEVGHEAEHFGTGTKKGRGMAQESLDLIEAMYAVAKAAQPITGRGIGYKLFTAGLIPSMEKPEMRRVYRLLKEAREQGHHPVGVDR